MSLSQEPAISTLKEYFVCGYTDITNHSYSGVSGRHEKFGNAIETTNGAGPRNLQLFMLADDGTVLHCLPGFWNAQDLVVEMDFASRLNTIWKDRNIDSTTKNKLFERMQLAHITEHDHGMVRRSKMQGFDELWEARQNLEKTDTICATVDKKELAVRMGKTPLHIPPGTFKTTDVIMHERMAKRPFLHYRNFDVARFSDYGKPKYDKNEDYRDIRTGAPIAHGHESPTIGNPDNIAGKSKKVDPDL